MSNKTINIDDLEAELTKKLHEVLETKKAINLFCKMVGEEPRYEEAFEERKMTATKRDEYFNKPLATAVRLFLEKKGEAAMVTEIIEELTNGGFDFGNERFADKNVRISLAKNTALFAYIKANDSFGLRKAYGMKVKEKLGKNNKKPEKVKKQKETQVELSEQKEKDLKNLLKKV